MPQTLWSDKVQRLSRVALTKRRRSLRKERNSFKYDTIEEERGTGCSQQSSSPSKSKSGSDDALADGMAPPLAMLRLTFAFLLCSASGQGSYLVLEEPSLYQHVG